MSATRLLLASLRHHWRSALGVVLGSAIAAAVLVGALAVGDSVRSSLRGQAEARIGRIDAALISVERFFASSLATRLEAKLDGTTLAPLLQLPGIARVDRDDGLRSAIIDVYGINERFFALSPSGKERAAPGKGEVFLNRSLAEQLEAKLDETILLRVENPSFLPRDLVLATVEDVSLALRVKVAAIVDDEDFGRFGFRSSQLAPQNAYLSLAWMQKEMDFDGRANLILMGGDATIDEADAALAEAATLDDYGLAIRGSDSEGQSELYSDRLFIGDAEVEAARAAQPELIGVLTYFVNEIRHGEKSTPYSMLTGVGPGVAINAPMGGGLSNLAVGEGEIRINDWLARDLEAKVGDEIELRYYVMGPALKLVEESKSFRVAAIVALEGAAADPSLMPDFPGLADAENCRDWEPGIPMDLDRIRDQDETYWDEHRGTPKAFLGLDDAAFLWRNRFGAATALRGPTSRMAELESTLPRRLDPATLGLFFRDIRGAALAGGTSATDFGGLFLGLSFFLIGSALLLTALLFGFSVEQRASEIGTLLALGLRRRFLRRLFLLEGVALATIGAMLGTPLGLVYTQAVLDLLGGVWSDAIGRHLPDPRRSPVDDAARAGCGIAAAFFAILLGLRQAFRRSALDLLRSRGAVAAEAPQSPKRSRLIAVVALVGAVLLLVFGGQGDAATQAALFFGGGSLLLIAGLAGTRSLLLSFGQPRSSGLASMLQLAMSNAARRPGRSLAVVALLASGSFLVVAVQAYRLSAPADPSLRASGTGGFALYGRSKLPVLRDLQSESGREAFGLDAKELRDAAILPFRVRDGDDASCLNLSLPQNPRLVGVDPEGLADREAFEFAAALDDIDAAAEAWRLLARDYGDDVVPAIGDAASITWTLKKSLGEDLSYRDEQGELFKVRIVATLASSVLQGDLVISETQFQRRFPSNSGHKLFLIDAPAERSDEIRSALGAALEDVGLELSSTGERLEALNAVQNSYLSIFQALGGLGLLLGSFGLGTVLLRNALERRSELAIARALGFTRATLGRLLRIEHLGLLGLGILLGSLAASATLLPLGATGSLLAALPMLIALLVSGLVWVFCATWLALRTPLIAALRDD